MSYAATLDVKNFLQVQLNILIALELIHHISNILFELVSLVIHGKKQLIDSYKKQIV